MAVQSYLAATAIAGAIVLFGALYAALLALSRLQRRRVLLWLGGAAYGCLAVSTLFLVRAIDLHGAWLAVPFVLLAGYLWAPLFIWRLCVSIEGASPASAPPLERGDLR